MTWRCVIATTCAAGLLAAASIAGPPPPSAKKEAPGFVSPKRKPTWHAHRMPKRPPGKQTRGPRLVVLEPTVGSLLTGQWPYTNHKWELFWHAENTGTDATTRPATLRIQCEVTNIDPGNAFGSDVVLAVCSQAEGTFPLEPLAAGATSRRTYATLIAPLPDVTCGPSAVYARLTAWIEPAPPHATSFAGERLVLDFCK